MATGKKKSTGKLSRVKKAIGKRAAERKTATAERKSAKSGRKSAAANRAAGSDLAGGEWSPSRNGAGSGEMDLDFLRGLIAAVDQSGIDSVEIDREGTKVRISKTPPAAPVSMAPMHAAPMMHAPAVQQSAQVHHAPSTGGGSAAPAAAPAAEAAKSNYSDIKSPMVGTFYLAPAPEAPPYVEIGSHVTKGQTLCILEAMKLMNELESEVDGIVREILVDNADPVEYGQVLFRIEPASR